MSELGLPSGLAAEQVQRFIEVLTKHTVRRGKHLAGHAGQKVKAKARRRGTHGKAVRRRHLAARREQVRARSQHAALSDFRAPVIYDETVK